MDPTKPLIVLDLDGTLILRRDKTIHKRNGFYEFLDHILEKYYVGIYTSITSVNLKYVSNIFENSLDKFSFIWDRKYTLKDPQPINDWDTIKNISKIREEFPCFEKILLLEDSPRKVRFNNPSEVLIVPKFVNLHENYNLKELIPIIENKLNN